MPEPGVPKPGDFQAETSTASSKKTPRTKKKTKAEQWRFSEAKKILKKALAKGEDERGNKVLLDKNGMQQQPRNIYKLFKDLPEFQMSDFNVESKFHERLRRLREAVTNGKAEANRDRIRLENSLEIHPIPSKRLFVNIALPLLRIDMDANKHLEMTPKQLHNTRPEYQEFKLEKFRKHIHQEVYTRKACIQYKWKCSRNAGEQFPEEIFKVDSLDEDGDEDEEEDNDKDDEDD